LKLLEEQLGGGGQPLFDTTAEHVFKWENVKYGAAMFNISLFKVHSRGDPNMKR
jgi:hypothetical protein